MGICIGLATYGSTQLISNTVVSIELEKEHAYQGCKSFLRDSKFGFRVPLWPTSPADELSRFTPPTIMYINREKLDQARRILVRLVLCMCHRGDCGLRGNKSNSM